MAAQTAGKGQGKGPGQSAQGETESTCSQS
jgi:hypothetical protein